MARVVAVFFVRALFVWEDVGRDLCPTPKNAR